MDECFGAPNTNKCLPLTLGFGSKCLKRHVVVLHVQTNAKKCIRASATRAGRLNHLACKKTYPGTKLLHISC